MANFQLANWLFFNIGFIKNSYQTDTIVINESKYWRKKTKSDNYQSPIGGCHLLSVDDETFHACWIRRHDTGRSNILPKK